MKAEHVEGALAIWCKTSEDYPLDVIEQRKGPPLGTRRKKVAEGKGETAKHGEDVAHGDITKEDA